LDPRNSSRRAPRRQLEFSLTDTIDTLTAKKAVRAGLSPAAYADVRDVNSPTNRLLTDPRLSPEQVGLLNEEVMADAPEDEREEVMLFQEAAAALPKDPAELGRLRRLAAFDGHARSWGAEQERGTFAEAVRQALTAEEAALLAEEDEDALAATVAQYQRTVDDYSAIAAKDESVAAGVAVAAGRRDAALATLGRLREARAKVDAVSARFDAAAAAAVKDAAAAAAATAPLA